MVLTLGTEVPSTPADGLVNTIWVPSIKNIQKPTASEISAGTDLSNYVTLGAGRARRRRIPSPTSVRTARRITRIPVARRSAAQASRSSTTPTLRIPLKTPQWIR